MKEILTEQEKQFLIDKLQKGEPLPFDFKYKLFPTSQKEYELNYAGKMRKQDVLRGEDSVLPVPLQIEKIFNGERELYDDGWRNMIIFGDNLQFLKTCYQNEDEIIKDKIKGKVKLIYIDPPFGTGDEYDAKQGQKGYSAKRKSADFVEFIRRRLIVAKELLSTDGNIFVRQDYHFGHYIKIVLDEIFGKEKFRNEFIVNRINKKGFANRDSFKPIKYPISTDVVFYYANSNNSLFNYVKIKKEEEQIKEKWHSMDVMDVNPQPRPRIILGKEMLAPQGRKWMFSQENIYEMEKEGLIKLNSKGNPIYKGSIQVTNATFILVNI